MDRRWSPEQICDVLRIEYPDRPQMWLAPETVYQALYRPDRGGLSRNRTPVLRTGRTYRKRRRAPEQRTARFGGPITMVCDRPAAADDRTVAGHWEGDLIMGAYNRSAIGTLVERTTRYVVLVHLPHGRSSEHVRDALIAAFAALPSDLRRSLTWDQGIEMARHRGFTTATNVPVYFCDPATTVPFRAG